MLPWQSTSVRLWFGILLILVQKKESYGDVGVGESKGSPPPRQLQLTANMGEQGTDFQEELRGAMSSHWEILQNIRYHTLISKMKVAQLDKKVKKLAKQIEGMDDTKPTASSSEAPCDEEESPKPSVGRDGKNQTPVEDEGNELLTLVTSLKELAQIYESFNYTTGAFDQPMIVESSFERLMQVLRKLETLARKNFQKDPGKRMTRKSTKVLSNATIMTTSTTTTERTKESDIFSEEIGPFIRDIQSSNLTVHRGKAASLRCQVLNRGTSTVVWTKSNSFGGFDILTAGQYVYSSDNRMSVIYDTESRDWVLTIKEVKWRDKGMYRCEVNSIPSVYKNFYLTVEDEAQPSFDTSSTVDVSVPVGTTAFLNCRIMNLGNHDVSWRGTDHYGNSVLLTYNKYSYASDSRFGITHDEDSQDWTLTIEDVRNVNEGFYTCIVNTNPSLSHTVSLTVYEIPPTEASVPSPQVNVTIPRGSSYSFNCTANSSQNWQVFWTRDKDQYVFSSEQAVSPSNQRIFVDHDPENTWALTIQEARESDEGTYKCLWSPSTFQTSNSELLLIVHLSVDVTPFIADDNEDTAVAEEGSTASLHCRVGNLGGYTVSWVRSSDLQILTAGVYTLSLDDRFKALTNDNETWYLQINNSQKEDEGEYLCQVSSDPVTSHRFWLTVSGSSSPVVTEREIKATTPVITTTIAVTTSTEAPYCFHPFKIIPGDLCVLHVTLQKLNWMDASTFCRSEGGELAVEFSASIQSFLEQQNGIEGENWTMWPFWVGAKEERNQSGEREWRWINGSHVESKFWASNQPRRYGKRKAPQGSCMVLDGYEGYNGVALPCQYRRRFICVKQR